MDLPYLKLGSTVNNMIALADMLVVCEIDDKDIISLNQNNWIYKKPFDRKQIDLLIQYDDIAFITKDTSYLTDNFEKDENGFWKSYKFLALDVSFDKVSMDQYKEFEQKSRFNQSMGIVYSSSSYDPKEIYKEHIGNMALIRMAIDNWRINRGYIKHLKKR